MNATSQEQIDALYRELVEHGWYRRSPKDTRAMWLGISIGALTLGLFVLHARLPAGRRTLRQIAPGIVFTIVASLVSGIGFGLYLARFANNYVTMYAGLASVIIALVFLYFISAIFVFGGELNAAIIKSKLEDGVTLQAAQLRAHEETPA